MLLVLAVVVPRPARATFGSCANADAPATHNTSNCLSVCTVTGSELTCETGTACPGTGGALATAVTNFGGSSHDLSVWGTCLSGVGTKFCCWFDDSGTSVDTVTLDGTDGADEVLSFTYDLGGPNERNLQPWDADPIEGFIRGEAGNDTIRGSNYAGTDYEESLFGHNGIDTVNGNDGGDFLSGGNAHDLLMGDGGSDTIWGGDGDDDLIGGANDDRLCDASGYNSCASDEGNYFHGGIGDDKIWYNESENPGVPCPNIDPDPASDAGGGTNECGDSSNYLFIALSCTNLITTVPTRCDGAN